VPRLLIEHEVRADAATAGAARRLTSDGPRWPAYQRAVWRKFGAIQVFTERDARAIEHSAPDVRARVFVNPFGATIPSAGPVTDDAGREIVFVGGFQHPPNVDAALWLADEIFPGVLRSVPDARLTLVGNDPPRAVRLRAGPHVLVTGRVPDTEPYLRRAAVVAAPLREGGGMRVKVLQAMALGKPLVATPLAAEGLRIDAGPPALRIAGSAQAFAHALAELLASPMERSLLGAQARAYVEREHDWDRYVARIEAVYAALVSGD
jgi:glycosyltransferase involved in cell wall biosynthesis